ncbi:hypothetical protein GCM10027521_54710 [Amycolatopsis cihanbeyliensis]
MHIGSAHDDVEPELLRTVARQRLAAAQGGAGPRLGRAARRGRAVADHRVVDLWDALSLAYEVLGFEAAAAGDEVFRQLVLARIIEPTSKLDSLRVLKGAGITPVSYRTLKRRLPTYAKDEWRESLAALCAPHVGLGWRRCCSTT